MRQSIISRFAFVTTFAAMQRIRRRLADRRGGIDAMETWMRFALAALATWRLTHLFAKEDGSADLIAGIRRRIGQNWLGSLMDCFQCLSLWVAAPLALFVSSAVLEWAVSWLALSGAACLLERTERSGGGQAHAPDGAQDFPEWMTRHGEIDEEAERGGSLSGMLRTEAGGGEPVSGYQNGGTGTAVR